MNIIFLSPQFSQNHYLFCEALRKRGINALGIGDAAYDSLRPELTQALDEYYKVDNITDYAEVFRAVAYFTYHYGKIDRLESLSYNFLDLEARLRTDFNIPGINQTTLEDFSSSLALKKLFRKARANVLNNVLADTLENGQSFVNKVGYPVLAKADNTLLSEKSCLLTSNETLKAFFKNKSDSAFILEEILEGTRYSYEGLIDLHGQVVFETILQTDGQNSTMLPELNPYFYSLPDLPVDIVKIGRHILTAATAEGVFFSIQFLRTNRKKLIALDIKLCPDSEFTPDIFNYSNDFNIYAEWPNALLGQSTNLTSSQKYYCAYIGRRQDDHYTHSHEEILSTYGPLLLQHRPIPAALASRLGTYGYIVRSTNLNTIMSVIDFAHQG